MASIFDNNDFDHESDDGLLGEHYDVRLSRVRTEKAVIRLRKELEEKEQRVAALQKREKELVVALRSRGIER